MLCLVAVLTPAAFGAAEADESASPAVVDELTVTAPRIDLSVSGGLVPELSFDGPLIRSLGASSLEELMEELAPEVSSGRGGAQGPPAYLVNGRRISNFREIRGYPPESVERIEIYPEEVALRHGFRPDQKVVNIVLRERFRALELEAEAGAPRSGAGERLEAELARLQLDGNRRVHLELAIDGQRPVHESDREIVVATRNASSSRQGNLGNADGGEIDPALSRLAGTSVTRASLPTQRTGPTLTLAELLATANDPVLDDQRAQRTLVADRRDLRLVGSYARGIGGDRTASVTGTFEQGRQRAELGVPGYRLEVPGSSPFSPFASPVQLDRLVADEGVLERRVRTRTAALDVTLTGGFGPLLWSWLNEFSHDDRRTDTDRGLDGSAADPDDDPFDVRPLSLPALRDAQTSTTLRGASQLLVSGPVDAFAAGPANVSASLRYDHRTLEAETETGGVARRDTADRGRAELRGSVDVPLLASQRLGRLGGNLNLEYADLSDFGTLASVGAGLTWRPTNALRVILSWAREEAAPGLGQLGDPLVRTPNQRIFDFTTGASVTITRLDGGNPGLDAEERETWRLGLRLEPFDRHDVTLNLDVSDRRVDDPIIGFPTPSEEIEAAFPERFERDANGVLTTLDARPLNVREARQRRIDWGLRYTHRLELAPPERATRGRTDAGGGDRLRAAAPRLPRGLGRRRGGQGGRLWVSLRHGWRLEDRLDLDPGLDPVDYVGRSAGGRQGGGAEHDVALRVGLNLRAWSGRARWRWQDGTTSLPAADGSIGLRNSALGTLDLEARYTVFPGSPLAERLPALTRARLSVGVDNAFADKARVRDALGAVPAGSSADELDPLGRVVYLEFRRLTR